MKISLVLLLWTVGSAPVLAQDLISPDSSMVAMNEMDEELLDPSIPLANDTDVGTTENEEIITETPTPTETPSINTSNGTSIESAPPTSPPTQANPMTAAPTEIPQFATVPVVGQIPLKLLDTPSLLIGDVEQMFLSVVESFLNNQLEVQDSLSEEVLELTQVVLLRQFRQPPRSTRKLSAWRWFIGRGLQEDMANTPLYTVLQVVGRRTYVVNGPENDSKPFELSGILELLFTTFGDEFIAQLRSEDAFWSELQEFQITTIEEGTTPFPTPSPTDPPLPLPSPAFQTTTKNEGDDDSPFSIGLIVGIAAASAAILVLLALIACRLMKNKDAGDGGGGNSAIRKSNTTNNAGAASGDSAQKKRWSRPFHNSAKKRDANTTLSKSISESSSRPLALQEAASDLESQGLYSYGRTDSGSVMGGSIMQNNSIMGMDTMSYAYSLEPGFEPSVMDGSTYGTDTSHSRAVPMEIPQFTLLAQSQASSEYGSSAPTSHNSDFGMETDIYGSIQNNLNGSPSDLELTGSELAMLPSNLKGSEDDMDANKTKEVVAPPGKLGIVIDTTVEGPVVHRVNEGSALKGKLHPGDIIVGIDDVDTRAMSASAITALMVKTANQRRRLTIIDNSQN